ncbi:MAG: O-acetylhomoserine aminocarboxypropyltransferase/cysteine synthase [Chloroflexi bacterium]|nr:O-acetylhomoserine aminocarboxypropyltransferase/cysteine synthase [Chloroflexota bacterium]
MTDINTLALHAGYDPTSGGGLFPPLHMAVAYPYDSAERGRLMCLGEDSGFTYSRVGNPTNDILEKRLAVMEGGEAGLATASGLAAVFMAVLQFIEKTKSEVVCSGRVYGNTKNQLRLTWPTLGVTPRFVDSPHDLSAWEAAINENTAVVYVESPSNPDVFVADVKALADLAHQHNLPLIIDSTLATPVFLRPLSLGADVVIHSATKYLSGHSAALGGVIVGQRDWVEGIRNGHYHFVGPTMSAFNAWLTLMGIETVGLRMARAVSTAQKVAEFLAAHPNVQSVNYPGLPTHPQHSLAIAQMGCGGTSLLSFVVEGGTKGAWAVLESLKVIIQATHLGSNQTVAVHPATTTHVRQPPEMRQAAGVLDGMIRCSVGLEDPGDLIADLDQALATIE